MTSCLYAKNITLFLSMKSNVVIHGYSIGLLLRKKTKFLNEIWYDHGLNVKNCDSFLVAWMEFHITWHKCSSTYWREGVLHVTFKSVAWVKCQKMLQFTERARHSARGPIFCWSWRKWFQFWGKLMIKGVCYS